MDATGKHESYLGFKKQDWWTLLGDFLFFFFMLFWPAMKTLVVVKDHKKFIGRWSTYWIGLPSFMMVYFILRLVLKWWIIFPVLEAILGVICSYNNGAIIQKFAVKFIAPLFKSHYSNLRKVPDHFGNIMSTAITLPFNFIFKMISSRPATNTPKNVENSDDE